VLKANNLENQETKAALVILESAGIMAMPEPNFSRRGKP
jgi:hypothetical protein